MYPDECHKGLESVDQDRPKLLNGPWGNFFVGPPHPGIIRVFLKDDVGITDTPKPPDQLKSEARVGGEAAGILIHVNIHFGNDRGTLHRREVPENLKYLLGSLYPMFVRWSAMREIANGAIGIVPNDAHHLLNTRQYLTRLVPLNNLLHSFRIGFTSAALIDSCLASPCRRFRC